MVIKFFTEVFFFFSASNCSCTAFINIGKNVVQFEMSAMLGSRVQFKESYLVVIRQAVSCAVI